MMRRHRRPQSLLASTENPTDGGGPARAVEECRRDENKAEIRKASATAAHLSQRLRMRHDALHLLFGGAGGGQQAVVHGEVHLQRICVRIVIIRKSLVSSPRTFGSETRNHQSLDVGRVVRKVIVGIGGWTLRSLASGGVRCVCQP
jgi:hypothetical protein